MFCDVGAARNPRRGGFGVILSCGGRTKEFCRGYERTTNNQMELMGVINALSQLKVRSCVTIFTDSQYLVQAIERGWAVKWWSLGLARKRGRVPNYDLWERLLELVEAHVSVRFV